MAEFAREIKRRIRSIRNTQQITSAMELVAVSRLRRLQAKVESTRPYVNSIAYLMGEIAAAGGVSGISLTQPREVQRVGVVVITADRGLCGAYNGNILEKSREFIESLPPKEIGLILIGKKGYDFFKRRSYPILSYSPQFSREIPAGQLKEMVVNIIRGYEDGTYDELHLFYARFVTILQNIPTRIKLLPVVAPAGEREEREYIFEPPTREILEDLLPAYLRTQVFQALLESMVSEQGARMIAMKSATENAEEMIGDLTLSYNKARQAGITKEILEITSAAEALAETRRRR